jgi:threonylcarbamoyladenosine tRNA methylthiotransferase MtaB
VNTADFGMRNGNREDRFIDLIRALDDVEGIDRFRISSVEPNLLSDEIIEFVASSDRFVPHFHIPLQSGSPEILKKMKRRYKVDYYNELIHKIKSSIPHCAIGVDVIVGFPGETDEHYQQTYDLLQALPVSYLHVFTYSERELTPAAKYPDPVPERIRKERTLALRELSNIKKNAFYDSQIGSVRKVIPETIDDTTGRWKGWTENYIRVLLDAPENIDKSPKKVLLKEIIGDHVYADLV